MKKTKLRRKIGRLRIALETIVPGATLFLSVVAAFDMFTSRYVGRLLNKIVTSWQEFTRAVWEWLFSKLGVSFSLTDAEIKLLTIMTILGVIGYIVPVRNQGSRDTDDSHPIEVSLKSLKKILQFQSLADELDNVGKTQFLYRLRSYLSAVSVISIVAINFTISPIVDVASFVGVFLFGLLSNIVGIVFALMIGIIFPAVGGLFLILYVGTALVLAVNFEFAFSIVLLALTVAITYFSYWHWSRRTIAVFAWGSFLTAFSLCCVVIENLVNTALSYPWVSDFFSL